ncbi:hypothetical protein D3C81_2002190 [compost metagenome]
MNSLLELERNPIDIGNKSAEYLHKNQKDVYDSNDGAKLLSYVSHRDFELDDTRHICR